MIPEYDHEAVEDWDTPEIRFPPGFPASASVHPSRTRPERGSRASLKAGTVAMAVYAVADMQPHCIALSPSGPTRSRTHLP